VPVLCPPFRPPIELTELIELTNLTELTEAVAAAR
jgi:hypothetical protein